MNRVNYKKLPMIELIEYTQNLDMKATAELIKRSQKGIYTFFAHLCPVHESVSDLTQETLIKIVKNIRKLKDSEHFGSWSHKIAINIFYDSIRRQNRCLRTIDSDCEDVKNVIDNKMLPCENCQSKELESQIKLCIVHLPVNARLAIILRELKGFSYEEIAKLTNTNLGTVKSRIARAREKLQGELSSYL